LRDGLGLGESTGRQMQLRTTTKSRRLNPFNVTVTYQ
jgi:hypothetical protein